MVKKLEVIMAAYNNVAAMKLVLDGYLAQKDKLFSLCVADDGSTGEVKQLVEFYRKKQLNIRHVWHEDKGFRRAKILNKALASSEADYIVFTDNDCIPSPYFVADHRAWAEAETMISGRRVDLGSTVTKELLDNNLTINKLNNPWWLLANSINKKLSRAENAIRFPLWFCNLWSKKPRNLLGANMAVWLADLNKVNGFDNDFVGYGCEEVDLQRRLEKVGLKIKTMRGRGSLFHLHHPENSLSAETQELIRKKAAQDGFWAENGMSEALR